MGLFFALINGEYRYTFFSVETGAQMTRRNFLEGNDVMKVDVFTNYESIWGKVEAWVKAGWKKWEQEMPEWFTDGCKASVPKYMIPAKKERGGVEAGGEVSSSMVVHSAVVGLVARSKSSINKIVPFGEHEGGVNFDEQELIQAMKSGNFKM
ncbi:hypothetical protein TrLO_g3863 [Triparma laevis f. longispina]|uniref:Uncharacterized protein n=1 Tax=Triparma laevis f. longispina TaxID=1714387 RepID=A0A9W7E9Z6_9STRA|nr:hypothetical protein TrLO_g3863 [Triparma laevis f. longispina]